MSEPEEEQPVEDSDEVLKTPPEPAESEDSQEWKELARRMIRWHLYKRRHLIIEVDTIQ